MSRIQLNRRDENSGVSMAVTVHDMDVMAEFSGMNLQRVTVVLAQKAAFSHPCDRDIPFILNIPAAGNGLD
ncbi:hypothetical protein LMH66_20260 [Shewanella sp. 10N.7]|uniref:hypothetical protein n=1 Tax=Shewanella sp. 10N.7 TaxID=2885093 RepID=UPI001E4D4A20|nr:hypothetical protein [Shewanella sp. 10N.7]MCC4834977.1 hypothetical protein [Shewanella sp. 10N.7]